MLGSKLRYTMLFLFAGTLLAMIAGCGAGIQKAEVSREQAINKRQAVDLFIEGKSAEAKELYADAITSYMEAFQYDPTSEEIASALAKSFVRVGKLRSAIHYTRIAVDLNPSNGENWLLLQRLLQHEGDTVAAAEALEMYMDVTEKKDISNVLQLAWYYFELDRDDEAIKLIRGSIEDNTTPASDMGQAADILARQGYPEEAEDIYKRLIDRDPMDEEAWLSLGQLYESLGREDDALDTYRQGLEKVPESMSLMVSIGNFCLEMNDWDCAIDYFEQTARSGVEQTKLYKTLAALYFYAGRDNDGLSALKALQEEGEDDAALYFSLGKAMNYLERYADATGYYRQGMNSIDNTISEEQLYNAFMGYAAALVHTDDAERAIELVRDIAPEYIEDREQLKILEASIYLDLERYSDAQAIYEWLVASDPQNIQYISALGHVYALQNKFEEAIETLRRVEEINPNDIGYLIQLSLVYDNADQFDNAEDVLERILEMEPDNALALNNLAYMYIEHERNLSKAIKMTERAIKLSPRNGAYYDTLAWGYFKKGDYKKAREYIENALEWEDPEGLGVIYDHYGDILAMLKMKEQAVAAFNKAIEMGEDPERIQKKIDDLR